MQRCLQLAALGAGYVIPNPLVGSVLVHEGKIIGEGYHRQWGEPHAEVNCINNVPNHLRHLISESTIYVSLEPCAHFGKTPPCADLIIRNKIPNVVVGIRDPFEAVNGKGIEKLNDAGIEVIQGVLENKCREINRRFFTFHTKQRPYIILKWAQTADGFIAPIHQNNNSERLLISNAYTNRLVHKWRSEEAAILVGTNTALSDNPSLTNRLWKGLNPVRLVVDKQLNLTTSLHLFDQQVQTIVFNEVNEEKRENLHYQMIDKSEPLPLQICKMLYQLNLTSLIVEGGKQLLQSFIDTGCFDEIRLIENEKLRIGKGLPAPLFANLPLVESIQSDTDRIAVFRNAL